MPAATVAQVMERFRHPETAARPMMRWWWFGPDVEDAELDRELQAMAAAGLGGAEVALVYPLRPGSPEYLSDEVMGHLRHAAETARELGLRLDVTLGSGWSYGGGHIGADHASRRLRWERRDLGPAALAVDLVPSWPGDEVVGAYLGDGVPPSAWTALDLRRSTGTSPSRRVHLEVPAGRGPRTVLTAWSETTGQQVKRAAAGAEGPVLDHLSAAATRHHLDVVGERILQAVPAELLGSVFSDSLEVYDAGWTAGLPAHFHARRGYDPLPLLHLLEVDAPGSANFREDFARTLSELVEENFVAVCRQWAEEHGVRFRLQGYGEPPITLNAQRSAHLIEGEGVGWTSLTQSRWASSAAHLDDRDCVSSEIWTWVHSPSFRATPLDLLGEAHEHLLLGITRFVGHGWPYTAPDAPGTGWTFYAAGALDDRNAWWPAMPELTEYLTRLGAVMSAGRPGADVALYLPYADVRAARRGGHDLWRACREHVGEEIPALLRRSGYDLDLVDDDALATLDPAAHPLVVLPRVHRLPEAARGWLDRVREAGGTVLAVDSPAYPDGVAVTERPGPGAAAEGFEAGLLAVLDPPVLMDGAEGEVGVVRRRLEDGDLYLLVNTGPARREVALRLREPRAHLEQWDPASGRRTLLPADGGTVPLHPYQAMLMLARDEKDESAEKDARAERDESAERVERVARDESAERVAQDEPAREQSVQAHSDPPSAADPSVLRVEDWTLSRGDASPQPVRLPHLRGPAPDPDPSPLVFETTVHLSDGRLPGRIVLDLGEGTPLPRDPGAQGYRADFEPPVREIAVVEVDGTRCGVLWRPPYRLDLTASMQPGENQLRILVHGTTAPVAAADAEAAGMIAAAHAAYGERFQQQDLERMLDGVATGLGAVPRLRLL